MEEPLADVTPEADAVVNVGDCNEYIRLPVMEKIMGDEGQVKFLSGGADTSLQPDGSISVSLSAITGSVNAFGGSNMSSYVY